MPTLCECPSCSRKLQVPDHLMGAQVKCPSCQTAFKADVNPPAMNLREQIQSAPAPVPPAGGQGAPGFDMDTAAALPAILHQYPNGLPTTRAVLLIGLLVGTLVLDVANIGVGLVELLHFQTLTPAQFAAEQEDLTGIDFAIICLGLMTLPLMLFTAVVFCMWIYQAHASLSQMGVANLTYSPGWAVGYFFIPILNLFRPFQVMQEIWKASDPDTPLDQPGRWRVALGSAFIGWWWGCWLISNFAGQLEFRISMRMDPTLATATSVTILGLVSNLFSIGACIFLCLVVMGIRERQLRKYDAIAASVR